MKQAVSNLFILLCLALVFPLSAGPRDLPALKPAPEVNTGTFPNGISYYIVANTSSKGYANFALAQQGADDQDAARAALSSLPHFEKVPPYMFAASKGIGYSPYGYVKYAGTSSVYTFEDVPSFDSAALDSTLVMVFDMMRRFGGRQAIIVSGDVDTDRLKDRLYLLSLTVGAGNLPPEEDDYSWEPGAEPGICSRRIASGHLASMTVTYRTARTPRELLSTSHPLVVSMLAEELGHILRNRIANAFADAGIPLADMDCSYLDSSGSPSDEEYAFTLYVDEADLAAATSLFAGVLSNLDSEGVTMQELQDAKASFTARSEKLLKAKVSNAWYVDACVSSFLYGSAILSRRTAYDFLRGRKIAPLKDLELFNGFVSALLDPRRCLTVSYGVPSGNLDEASMRKAFLGSWVSAPVAPAGRVSLKDTLKLSYAGKKKVKLKAEAADPMTGGSLWTFSNGMKVLFRKTAGSELRYSWLLKGGCSEVPDIARGESAFIGDMLGLYRVAGMSGSDFRYLLGLNGIKMDCKVSLSDMRIEGTAPTAKAELVLRSLLSLAHQRKPDSTAFDYYRRCERLRAEAFRMGSEGVNAVMDSLICPEFFYPSIKNTDCLSGELPGKADRYFSAQFLNSNDGVLFIEGDLDAEELKKLLCRYLGTFFTGNRYSLRPKVQYELRSGLTTYTVDRNLSQVGDGGTSANMEIALLKPFSMKTWCTFKIAVEALRCQLVNELAPLGNHVRISTQLQLLPAERLAVYINVMPCKAEGLPAGVEPADPYAALQAIRDAIGKVVGNGVGEGELKGYKESLSNEIANEIASPGFLMEVYLRRISEGKDMVSNYSSCLAGITSDDVASLLRDFGSAGKVEYIIK